MRTVAFLLLLISSVAFAGAEFMPMEEAAQGQSLAGANLLNDSLYANPAGSSLLNVYSVDGTFEFPKTFAASVLDTQTSSLGGAFGYFREGIDGSKEALQGLKGALSTRVAPNIGIGIAGKSLWGPAQNANGSFYHDKMMDVDVGTLMNFGRLQVGGTLRNLFGGNPNLDDQDREFSLGGRINYDQILFFSTAIQSTFASPKPYQYGFGAEYVSPYFLSISGGYRIQPYNSLSYWSAGIGFISPKLSLHYAVVFPSSSAKPTTVYSDTVFSTTHYVGATLLF